MTNAEDNARFNLRCMSAKTGGFAKEPDTVAEILHSFYSVAGLSLVNDAIAKRNDDNNNTARAEQQQQKDKEEQSGNLVLPVLRELDPAFGISVRALGGKRLSQPIDPTL